LPTVGCPMKSAAIKHNHVERIAFYPQNLEAIKLRKDAATSEAGKSVSPEPQESRFVLRPLI